MNLLISLSLALLCSLGLCHGAVSTPRLLEVIPNGGLSSGQTNFGGSIDFDGQQILVGCLQGAHVYDQASGDHLLELGAGFPQGFGVCVALTPQFYIVSSISLHTGAVHIFNRADGTHVRTITEPLGGPSESRFGGWIEAEGNRLFVFFHKYRAQESDPHQGAVYVYNMTTWEVERIITSGEGVPFDGFGQRFSVDGNTLVVGAERKDEFTGTCYIFDVDTGIRRAKIRVPFPGQNHWFGSDVAVKGDRVYASSRYGVFEYDASNGAYLGNFTPSPYPGYYDWFGSSIELTDSGLLLAWDAYSLFVFDAATRQQLEVIGNPFGDEFVSLTAGPLKAHGDILVTSASGGSDPGTKNGALLIYSLSPSRPVVTFGEAIASESDGEISVNVSVEPPSAEEVRVGYQTIGAAARSGIDFTAQENVLVLAPGLASGTITIPVTKDRYAEEDETFFVKILSVTGADGALVDTPLTIEDDDEAPELDLPPAFSPGFHPADSFGVSLVADGAKAFVGAKNMDDSSDNKGGVYLMNLKSRKIIRTIPPTGFADDSEFGVGLALDGNVLAVGASKSREDPSVPAVYFYNARTLKQVGKIVPPDADHSYFGHWIAMNSRHIVIGMPYEDKQGYQVGACLVYDRKTLAFVTRLEPPEAILGGQFGVGLALDGDKLAIGSQGKIFVRDLATNSPLYAIDSSIPELDHAALDFGEIIAMKGAYLVAGNPWDDSVRANSGSVLVFDSQTGELIDTVRSRSTRTNSPNFGDAVALDGDTLLVASGGQYQTDLHVVDLPSGSQRLHMHVDVPQVGSFFQGSLAMTSSYYVLATPRGISSTQGSMYSMPRGKKSKRGWLPPFLGRTR